MSHSSCLGISQLHTMVMTTCSHLAKAQDMNRLSEEIHDDDKEPASMYVKSDRVLGSQNDKGIVNKTFFFISKRTTAF